ncbi:lipoate--protein ligase family protein [Halalkalibacterium ligniniphilum]|uniref:lipoate--protein ligase family protein n=1 Tax=Halalkalibacterium ligniniphilum TaxID=1134413 RepID=UPI00034AB81F|nr:biotin/lipoate A/B protein ligase family protein [Halalkalibacterium ligniniphilum]
MNERFDQYLQQPWRFIDHTTLGPLFNALESFAYDDTFCTMIGQENGSATLRAWVHHHTVVLGIQDSRLPDIDEGLRYLQSQGQQVIIRNSGGLAVVLDEDVLNLSLIVKEKKGFTIDEGYELMYNLIKQMFSSFNQQIEAREIVGSYCPGSYDLSIGGKKFAGISQRRMRGGVAVQIYLCVRGSGAKRAEMIRRFYELSVNGKEPKFAYPQIVPETMASLSELLQQPLTVQDVMACALSTMKMAGADLHTAPLSEHEQGLFLQHIERMKSRNEKIITM